MPASSAMTWQYTEVLNNVIARDGSRLARLFARAVKR